MSHASRLKNGNEFAKFLKRTSKMNEMKDKAREKTDGQSFSFFFFHFFAKVLDKNFFL